MLIILTQDLKAKDITQKVSCPRLLVWSSAEEDGIQRLTEGYTEYFRKLVHDPTDMKRYLDDFTFILAYRRSALPWKSFAVIDSISDLRDLKRFMSTTTRSSNANNAAFVFTGQEAQHSQMGARLCQFPVFENSLRLSDRSFKSFGCAWSAFGNTLNIH